MFATSPGCSATTARVTSRASSPNGSTTAGWGTSQDAPHHPQTQDKIERWHQTLKNRILFEHYYLPGDLDARIEAFIDHYNHRRYYESLSNVAPADTCFGRDKAILGGRARSKRIDIEHRRLQHHKLAA